MTCVAFSPDGGLVASGDADGVVRLWRYPLGTSAQVLTAHEDAVLAIAFAPDGRCLVTGGSDHQVILWSGGGELVPIRRTRYASYVSALAFLPGDSPQIVISGHGDGVVRRRESGELLRLPGFACALAVDERTGSIIAGAADGSVWLAEAPAYANKTVRIGGHEGFVRAVRIAASGTAIISAGEDGMVRFWDLDGMPIHPALSADGHAVTSVDVSADSHLVAGGCQDGTVRVWDWLPSDLPGPAPQQAELPRLASGRRPDRWDRNGDQAGPAWVGHGEGVMSAAFTHDGQRVASVSWDRQLRIWSLDGTLLHAVDSVHDSSPTSVACSPQGYHIIATGGRDNTVRLWDLTGRPLGKPFTGHTADVMSLAFSPDGSLIATASRDQPIRLWQVDGTPRGEPFTGHTGNIMSIAFSPAGDYVVSGCRDGTVRAWRLDGTPYGEPFRGHGTYVWCVAVSPDGLTVASGGDDRTVWLWSPGGQAEPRPLRGHTGAVRAVAWSPADSVLVSTSADGSVRLWDPQAGTVARPLRGHSGTALSVAIRPDGEYAATGGDDRTVRLWRLGGWRSWLREGRDRVRLHPLAQTDRQLAAALD